MADWGGGTSASGKNSLTRATDGGIVCCGIISSRKSAATSKIVKALHTHARCAIVQDL